MRAEKFVVTTSVGGVARSEIWDPAHPLPLGFNHRWILERNLTGMRVRQADGQMTYEVVQGGLSLPNDLKLRIVSARGISPSYKRIEPAEGEVIDSSKIPQLLAFNGVGHGIISCQPVHGAYVAFVRTQPVFALYQDDKGIQIKPLLDGVKFKLKGQKPIPGPIGEVWKLQPEQLFGASVIRGSHWWRFNLVSTSVLLEDGPDEEAILGEEGGNIRKILLGLGATFLALSLALWLTPRSTKPVAEVKEEAIVKFTMPKPVTKTPPPVALVPPPPPPTPAKVAVAAPKPEAAAAKAPKLEKPKKAPPAKAVAKLTPPAPPAPAVATAPPAPKAPDAKAIAQKNATNKLEMLRAALGSAAPLPAKTADRPTSNTKAAGIFAAGTPSLAPTDIKPTYAGDDSKVGTVGGGYTQGEHASVGTGASAFVSLDSGGSTVEEGLTKEEVGAVIHQHAAEIRYCHETAMLYRPHLEGKLVVQFGIDPSGKVEKAIPQSSDLPDKTLEGCLMKRLVNWKFPHPKGGVHVNVSYPFLFKTLGRE